MKTNTTFNIGDKFTVSQLVNLTTYTYTIKKLNPGVIYTISNISPGFSRRSKQQDWNLIVITMKYINNKNQEITDTGVIPSYLLQAPFVQKQSEYDILNELFSKLNT